MNARRRFLRRVGAAFGTAALLGGAGCRRSDDLETERSPPSDGFVQTPRGSPTPTDAPDARTASTVATDIDPIDGSWPSYRLNAANTAATDEPGPTDEPALVWRRETAAGVRPATDPVAAGDGFVVVMSNGEPSALDADDGGIRWQRDLSVSTEVDPVGGDGTVVFVDGDTVVALSGDDGAQRWQTAVTGPVVGLDVGRGIVVAASVGGVTALALDDGTAVWDHRVDEGVATRPAVGDGVVAVGLPSGVVSLDAESGDQRWQAPVGEGAFAPTVGDGNVYVATAERLGAFDAGDGDRRWTVTPDLPVGAPPVARDDAIYLATFTEDADPGSGATGTRTATPLPTDARRFASDLLALSSDGTVRWQTGVSGRWNFTGGPPDLATAATADQVYVGVDETLFAFDTTDGSRAWAVEAGRRTTAPAVLGDVVSTGDVGVAVPDGAELWRFEVGRRVESSPAVEGNTVYVGSASGSLFAVDASAGTEQWHFEYGDRFLSATPALADGTVFAGANDVFRALEAADGTELWNVDVGPTRVLQSVPAVSDGRVFVNPGESLSAFDAADGTELWSRPTRGTVVNAPAVRDGTVYTPGGEFVHAFDASTGDREWRTSVGRAGWVVAGETGVFAASTGGSIVALDPGDGSERWRVRGIDPTRSPAVVDEYLFVGGDEGGIYAIGPDGT